MLSRSLQIAASLALASTSSLALVPSAQSAPASLDVMFYNVENLFDPSKDLDGRNDWEFTPKETPGKAEQCEKNPNPHYKQACIDADWTEARLAIKLDQIKRVLTEERAGIPDVLSVVEIENEAVIKKLARHVGYSGYAVTRQSKDERGLDLAVLYKNSPALKFVGSVEHVMDYSKVKAAGAPPKAAQESRSILEARFVAYSKYPVSIFVNHWPSQSFGIEYRIAAAEALERIVRLRLAQAPNTRVIAGGDFNVVEKESQAIFAKLSLPELIDRSADRPAGSYYYASRKEWNLLDRVFYSPSLAEGGKIGGGIRIVPESYQIHNPGFLTEVSSATGEAGVPWRYDFHADRASEAGFSDHFPIVLSLELPNSQ